MHTTKQSIIGLHIAVLLFGLGGVIGQFVEVPAVMVAWGRVVCSSILLLIIALVRREVLRLGSRRDYAMAIMAGAVLAVHWTSFFQSIQLSSVAIGTITFSTFPLFLTFMEPLIFHEKILLGNVLKAFVLLIGILITIPDFSLGNQDTLGIMWGMLSSLTYAILTMFNRYLSGRYDSRKVCMYEQGTAAIVLLPALFLVECQWRVQDYMGVAFLGFVGTAFAYSLYVAAQKNVKAQTAGIISGMETVYGIICAFLFLHEVPSGRELLGGVVIMGVVLISSIKPKEKKTENMIEDMPPVA